MVNDEVIDGDFGGREVQAEGLDVPMEDRIGIIPIGGARGQLGVRIVDPVEHKVVAATEAGVIFDGMPRGPSGKEVSKVGHGSVVKVLVKLLSPSVFDSDAAIRELHAGWECFPGLRWGEMRIMLTEVEREADDFPRHAMNDKLAALDQHGLQHLAKHWFLVKRRALLLPSSQVGLGDLCVNVIAIAKPRWSCLYAAGQVCVPCG